MNKTALGATAALLVIVAAVGGYWFGTQNTRTPAPGAAGSAASNAAKGPPPGAGAGEAVKVELVAMPQTITAVGSLRSDESITVRPEVAGRINAILFREGQPVAKGATLVRLDSTINQAEVQQGRANLKLAQSKYDRAVDLARNGSEIGEAAIAVDACH